MARKIASTGHEQGIELTSKDVYLSFLGPTALRDFLNEEAVNTDDDDEPPVVQTLDNEGEYHDAEDLCSMLEGGEIVYVLDKGSHGQGYTEEPESTPAPVVAIGDMIDALVNGDDRSHAYKVTWIGVCDAFDLGKLPAALALDPQGQEYALCWLSGEDPGWYSAPESCREWRDAQDELAPEGRVEAAL